ncbi:MAG: hypothetical protein Q9184_007347 [Pyrenodesmia sp. 2 TL-2023]
MPDGTWKREGPEEMMVSLDSARLWYPGEKHIACDSDHSHIARLKRGENGIYTLIRSAIKQAMLSIGDLYSEADVHYQNTAMSQAYDSDKPGDDRSNLERHRPVPLVSRSYGPAADQPRPDLERHVDQGVNRNLGESMRTQRPQSSSASYPSGDLKVSRWQLGLEKHERADQPLPLSPSISSESAMASVVSEAHDAADHLFSSATSIGADLNATWTHSSAGQVNRQGDEQIAPAKSVSTSDSGTAEKTPIDALRNSSVIRTEQVAVASHGLSAEASEAGTSDQSPQPVASTAVPQKSRETVIRKDEQVTTQQTQEAHEVEHEAVSFTDNQCTIPESTTTSNKSTSYDNMLKDAVKWGDIVRTKVLLATFFDVNCKDETGLTPLHDAAFLRNEPLVKLLLELGAQPRSKTIDGRTSLHLISHPEGSQTLLTENLIDVLLQHRPPLEEADQNGITPLMFAARKQELLLATKLISLGASTQLTDNSGKTVLHHATLGAKGSEVIALLIREGALVDARDSDEWTPLHHAAAKSVDSVEPCVELLLSSGANIRAKQGHLRCVKLLLSSSANNSAIALRDSTPLHLAAQQGHARCVELLLSSGADIEARAYGCTPLDQAAKNGNARCVELLLDSGASIEVEDALTAKTPLHHAVRSGHLQTIKTLLAHGANPLARSATLTGGQTPRSTPIKSDSATEEEKHEICTVLKEAEKEWKRSGKKYSKWRW